MSDRKRKKKMSPEKEKEKGKKPDFTSLKTKIKRLEKKVGKPGKETGKAAVQGRGVPEENKVQKRIQDYIQ